MYKLRERILNQKERLEMIRRKRLREQRRRKILIRRVFVFAVAIIIAALVIFAIKGCVSSVSQRAEQKKTGGACGYVNADADNCTGTKIKFIGY